MKLRCDRRIVAGLIVGWMLLGTGVRGAGFTDGLTPEEFKAAGLENLTSAQRATLDRLVAQSRADGGKIASRSQKVNTPEVPEAARVKRSVDPEPGRISSRLRGSFTGWSGSTVFTLENGQRWMQIDGGSYRAFPVRDAPEVWVIPATMDTYFLKIEGVASRCRVRLLED